MSNVRGPPEQLHIGGFKLSGLFGFLPTPPGVALGIGVGTYGGQISVSLTCDRGLLGDDATMLLEMMLEEANALSLAQPATGNHNTLLV